MLKLVRANLFWRFAALWAVGAPLAWFVAPAGLSRLFDLPADFPAGSRVSLVTAWLTTLLALLGAVNFWRRLIGREAYELAIPRGFRSWLVGGVAIAIGLLIGTTIFT